MNGASGCLFVDSPAEEFYFSEVDCEADAAPIWCHSNQSVDKRLVPKTISIIYTASILYISSCVARGMPIVFAIQTTTSFLVTKRDRTNFFFAFILGELMMKQTVGRTKKSGTLLYTTSSVGSLICPDIARDFAPADNFAVLRPTKSDR